MIGVQEPYRRVGLPKTKLKALGFMSKQNLHFGARTKWRWNIWMVINLIYSPKMLEVPLLESLGHALKILVLRKVELTG